MAPKSLSDDGGVNRMNRFLLMKSAFTKMGAMVFIQLITYFFNWQTQKYCPNTIGLWTFLKMVETSKMAFCVNIHIVIGFLVFSIFY
jgi:hypothetical protein